ncbi:3-oxoacyl-[acyl-carrier-protein] synthase III C-terminal domain-containing protein [Bacillus cereus]|uniref:3-oxoacyl-[acyl-carrier-protein] synthase III C-terminal domain-containing protein n=1 Tax=Bacillus nitratireducens TaxID=2026193 RepID=UPI000BF6EF3F|nr:hypothetical protein COI88_06355 [Bacillus cereus]
MNSQSRITAIGTYVPDQILSNNDLEKMIDTNDEWIVQRTGMKERRIANKEEYSSHLAIKAIENLCTTYKKNLEDIDCIIVATTTADYVFPSVACQIQQYFNIPHTLAFDLNATCAGFTYGREVYKWATRTVPAGIKELLHTTNMQIDDIDWFVPHSVNLRMIESICEKTEIPIQKTLTSVKYMGNTSSASIPLALDLARKEGKLNNGDTLLLYGFGGGLTHLGLIVEWGLD